jgi:hypothetical protein
MNDQQLQSTLQQMQADIDALKKVNYPFSSPALDPTTKEILDQQTAIPYFTSDITTTTPKYNGYEAIYKSGSNYILAVYADGGWRTQTLGASGTNTGAFSFTVPGSTLTDTTSTHDFGFVPKTIFGALTGAGTGAVKFFGIWQSGQELATSIVTDGAGTSSDPFCGSDASFYCNNLSISGTTLTFHYKQTGGSSATMYFWAIS